MEGNSSPTASTTPSVAPKKIAVFTPNDIKKIGLDKVILSQISQGGAKKVVTAPDGTTKTLIPLKQSLCANLKMKMQKALQENKGTVVTTPKKDDTASGGSTGTGTASTPTTTVVKKVGSPGGGTVVRKFVIIKSQDAKKKTEEQEGEGNTRKIKVMQNQVISVKGVSPGVPLKKVKCYDNANPPRKVNNGAPLIIRRKVTSLENDDDEDYKPVVKKVQHVIKVTPSFTKPPIYTYKRKRPGDEDESPKKIRAEGEGGEIEASKIDDEEEDELEEQEEGIEMEVEEEGDEEDGEVVTSVKKPGRKSIIEQVRDDEDGDITWTECPSPNVSKKRGKKTKAEQLAMLTKMLAAFPKKRGRKSKAEMAIISRMKALEEQVHSEEGDEEDEDDENVEYITLEVSPSVETKDEDAPPKVYKKRGRKSKAELAEMALLAKQKAEEDPSEEEDMEDDEDDDDEPENISTAFSPTRHGRVPKRNKMFEDYVTSMRKRSTSDAEASTPKPTKVVTPKVATGKKRGRKPKNWKPEDDEVTEAAVTESEEQEDSNVEEGTDEMSSNEDDNAMVDVSKEKDQDQDQKSEDDSKEEKVVKVIKESSIIPKKRGWKPEEEENSEISVNNNENQEETSQNSEEAQKSDETEAETNDDQTETNEEQESNLEEETNAKTTEEEEETQEKSDETTEEAGEAEKPNEVVEEAGETEKQNEVIQETTEDDAKKQDAVPEEGEKDTTTTTTTTTTTVEGDVEQPKVKRRGRKRTVAMMIKENPSTSAAAADGVDVPSKKRKAEDDVISNEHVADLNSSTSTKSHAEKTTAKMYRYLVASLVVSIRQTMATSIEQPIGPGKLVTCAVCKQHLKPGSWTLHKAQYHNNLAWKTTQEPLELDNHYEVVAEMKKLYPKKPYICELCGDHKRSILGYLTHRTFCQKTPEELEAEKIPCSLCDERIMPHQIVEHDKYHRKHAVKPQVVIETPVVQKQPEPDDGTPRKRNAAVKATQMIQQVNQDLSDNNIKDHYYVDLKPYISKSSFNSAVLRSVLKKKLRLDESVTCLFPKCEMKFVELVDLFTHMSSCNQKLEKYYVCKICCQLYSMAAHVRRHLNFQHAAAIKPKREDEDDYDYEEEQSKLLPEEKKELEEQEKQDEAIPSKVRIYYPPIHTFWKSQKFKFVKPPLNDLSLTFCPRRINHRNYCVMLKFCELNYNKRLFEKYEFVKSSWNVLNKNYVWQYLPKFKVSIAIGQKFKTSISNSSKNAEFSRYKLFQTSIINGIVNIFCGGPISSMAWAPTHHDCFSTDQILAVAVTQDPEYKYLVGKRHSNKSMIQLWNFGDLHNDKALTEEPTLELCIAHNFGGIFSMEWCPSGCFEESGLRLGLLLVCSTDGVAYCYSVGRSNLLSGKIFKPKPVFKLIATSKDCDIKIGRKEYYPSIISWTKAAGHKYVSVGYSNGTVAMFNLQTESPLLKSVDENNIDIFYPYFVFKADNSIITALILNHLDGGNRYLITSSNSRHFKFWDLNSPNLRPLIRVKRACARQIVWPVNALSMCGSHDDASTHLYLTSPLNHLVHFDYVRPSSFFYSHAAARTISASDWGSVIYLGNEAGQVSGVTYREMYPFVNEVPCRRFLCSNVSIIPENENKTEKEEVIDFNKRNNYKYIKDNYKILFHDYNMKRVPVSFDRFEHPLSLADFTKFPIQSATVTCTNNNRFSFLYTAVGYNIGFVRVYHSNFLNVS